MYILKLNCCTSQTTKLRKIFRIYVLTIMIMLRLLTTLGFGMHILKLNGGSRLVRKNVKWESYEDMTILNNFRIAYRRYGNS